MSSWCLGQVYLDQRNVFLSFVFSDRLRAKIHDVLNLAAFLKNITINQFIHTNHIFLTRNFYQKLLIRNKFTSNSLFLNLPLVCARWEGGPRNVAWKDFIYSRLTTLWEGSWNYTSGVACTIHNTCNVNILLQKLSDLCICDANDSKLNLVILTWHFRQVKTDKEKSYKFIQLSCGYSLFMCALLLFIIKKACSWLFWK